jgi:hypothetical protein
VFLYDYEFDTKNIGDNMKTFLKTKNKEIGRKNSPLLKRSIKKQFSNGYTHGLWLGLSQAFCGEGEVLHS